MKKSDLIQKSITILTKYYQNELDPFFDSLADDVLWIGPRKGQVLRGKDTMIRAWAENFIVQHFSTGDISVMTASTGRNNLEIMLEYDVLTMFPDAAPIRHHQRCQFSWGYRRTGESESSAKCPRICMIHLSNITSDVIREGQIYADSAAQEKLDAVTGDLSSGSFSPIMPVRLENEVTLFLRPESIMWIESKNGGRHSLIHSSSGIYSSTERLRSFEDKFRGFLLRAHVSYLINPLYVLSVKRFEVTLTDGTRIPVPQKKYTAFRHELEQWFSSRRDKNSRQPAETDRP